MKHKILGIGAVFFITMWLADVRGQAVTTDSLAYPAITVWDVHPQLLKKRKMLAVFGLEFPRYYKTYNPSTGTVDKVSDKVVLNEMYFNTRFIYGLTDRWNLHLLLPIADIHHYSPMGRQSGIGLGDIKAGIDYQLSGTDKNPQNSLAARLDIGFPTGRYKNLSPGEYPLGTGSFRFSGSLAGWHHFEHIEMIYSGYYEYRTDHQGISAGDETGLNLIFLKKFNTLYGNFGLEGGLHAYWNFRDKQNGAVIPNSEDYAAELYAGGWYQYTRKFFFRFGVPYSIYQNDAWMTRYRIFIQLNYFIN